MNMYYRVVRGHVRALCVVCIYGGGDVGGVSGDDGAEFGTVQHDPCTTRGGRAPQSCVLTPSHGTTWIPDRGREVERFCRDWLNRVQSSS